MFIHQSTRKAALARTFTGAAAASSLAVLLGCSSEPSPSPAPVSPPAFHDTTGETPRAPYPDGPYGLAVGSTIPNLELMGYPDPAASAGLSRMSMSDFYNPHGHDAACHGATPDPACVYPDGSGYAGAGKLKPTVLLIDISAGWCPPCQKEAAQIFPQKHALYAPCGGEVMVDLHEGVSAAQATAEDLTNWVTTYPADYPATIDPASQLFQLAPEAAFPINVIVDTTTMKIIDTHAGAAIVGTCNNVYECSKDADCGLCLNGGKCASGKACTIDADCSTEKCSPSKFWQEYEDHLDRSRPGCGLP